VSVRLLPGIVRAKSDKDAKGLGGHDRSGTPVQPRRGDVPGWLHQAGSRTGTRAAPR
jgi:hypothetical protein